MTEDATKAVFLVLLACMGNFIGETFACNIGSMLQDPNGKSDDILKQAIVMFLILFTTSLSEKKAKNLDDLYATIYTAISIWIGFNLVAKSNKFVFLIVFMLLCGNLLLKKYKHLLPNAELATQLENIIPVITWATALFGFYSAYRCQTVYNNPVEYFFHSCNKSSLDSSVQKRLDMFMLIP